MGVEEVESASHQLELRALGLDGFPDAFQAPNGGAKDICSFVGLDLETWCL